MINNIKPIFKPENLNGLGLRTLSKCLRSNYYLYEEGLQIYGLKGGEVFGALEGPPKTLYEKGYFLFKMIFSSKVPFKPLIFYFLTNIFHPNISEFGLVSIDIIKSQ